MRTALLGIALLYFAIQLSGCMEQKVGPNDAILFELDQAGQLMPGVPAIEGGCVAKIGANYRIDSLSFKGGDCNISMSKKVEADAATFK